MSTPTPRGAPPAEVRTAVWLWGASTVVGLAAAVVAALVPDEAVRTLVRTQLAAQPGLAGFSQDGLVRLVSILGVVLAVIWAGVKLALVLALRSGRSWARTVLLVLGALSVTSSVLGLRDAAVAPAVLGLLGAALTLAGGVAMYTGDANPYLVPRRTAPRP